ncbi:helicase SNF2 [Variovorax sp. J22P240]|uniref:helicase SNF2 n=1 Tax=Variovorax TaxID=34072 RepID=UPI002575B0C8|nr:MULTISPECIES: helicase SNF2 [unclassified Variovorax]MDM0001236.1 helicase SNF2 [Variovorax sp. J22P240]MDM0049960.1 helicase SNF2 [Variovorax sp. J22R115]MDM0110182.1 helicase SNF2 [Variovorax sp. J22R24]
MQSSKFIAAAALSLLAAVGAHAESYEGVTPPVSANSRAAVRAEAVIAAYSDNPYAEGASSHVTALPSSSADRSEVRRTAVAAAHGPDHYSDSYGQGVVAVSRGFVDRASARADARTAARSPQDPF